MWSNHDKSRSERVFSTPPASWKSSPKPVVVMPMSERKSNTTVKRDLFHVLHKVPSGDSPYVRAKHVQLIDKDPSRAISLFWAAINAGDRVDSALKDMAVVMKQLDRSDEAIEAIKSFRHLCTYDSQESLDNVLIELYKRSGKIEEEIEMLHQKLKNVEEGVAFGGKRTKTARSQGKKVQITVEQEKSRILGNLAWAYLQHHDYGLAEQYYRKALSLEPDYNKQCNLALCLMHMNRISEAKSLLHTVSASCGSKQMDESYAKSFERAVQMLNELESRSSLLKPIEEDKENQRSLASPVLSEKYNKGSYCENHSENQRNFFEYNKGGSGLRDNLQSSQHYGVDSDCWRKCHFESPGERSGFSGKMKENRVDYTGKELGSAHKKMHASPAAILYTQPKGDSGRFRGGGQRKVRWEEDTVEKPSGNLLAHAIRNLNGDLQESAALSKTLVSPAERNWGGRLQAEVSQGKSLEEVALDTFSQPRIEGQRLRSYTGYDGYAQGVVKHDSRQASWRRYDSESSDQMISEKEDHIMVVDEPRTFEASTGEEERTQGNVCDQLKSTDSVGLGKNCSIRSASKSWADMVEEEERKLLTGEDLSPYFDSWNYEECTDENLDSNIVHQSPCPKSPVETTGQNLEAFYDTFSNTVSPRNPTVRRSLCFDAKKNSPMRKKNRLQVFRDITPTPDSP